MQFFGSSMYRSKNVRKLGLFRPKLNKFNGFPKVNIISIEESEDRRSTLSSQCKEYGISHKFHIFPRYYSGLYNFTNDDYTDEDIDLWSNGPTTSHLLAIRNWLIDTDEPYGFFAEDDIDFSISEYWNFEWKDFFARFPSDWSVMQLSLVREHYTIFKFFPNDRLRLRHRCWCDWNLAGYMITRRHAEELIYNYMDGDNFRLKYCGIDRQERLNQDAWWGLNANAENIIFTLFGNNYVAPIFLEKEVNMANSTSYTSETTEYDYKTFLNIRNHSRECVLEWWKQNGSTLDLNEFFDVV